MVIRLKVYINLAWNHDGFPVPESAERYDGKKRSAPGVKAH
jgi:hypothetical protein